MKNFILAVFLVAACSAISPNTEAADSGGVVRFERIGDVSIKDFWNLTRAESIHAKSGAAIGFWRFDPEDAPRHDGWVAIGVAVGGLGDIGETPIAALVWTRGNVDLLSGLSNAVSVSSDDAVAVFGENGEACSSSPAECVKPRPKFIVSQSGKVVAGDKDLGVVE